MRFPQQELATVEALDAEHFLVYLESTGWSQLSPPNPRRNFYVMGIGAGEEQVRLLIPSDTVSEGDSILRKVEAIEVIQRVQQDDLRKLLTDLMGALTDVSRFGAETAGGTGLIDLFEGARLLGTAESAFESAAVTTIKAKASFDSKPARAVAYLKSLKLGQTEQGSYVFTVFSPLRARKPAIEIPEPRLAGIETAVDVPYPRKVVTRMLQSLKAVRDSAQECLQPKAAGGHDLTPFRRAVAEGVTANLCSSIARVGTTKGFDALEVRVAFSPAVSQGSTSSREHSVVIERPMIQVIEEASAELARDHRTLRGAFLARVIGLKRPTYSQDGKAWMKTQIGKKQRTFKVVLRPDYYRLACQAHEKKEWVQITGLLEQEEKTALVLNEVTDFKMVETPGFWDPATGDADFQTE